jgi:alanyl-tRNA synthetase
MKNDPEHLSTRRLYFEDAYQTEFEADVVERLTLEGHPAVVLDRTAFYPESGGQPWDLGTINGVPVVKVAEDGERIVHALAREISAPRVAGKIDWNVRFDHMQQHTGQHVLSQAFLDVLHGETKSFHLGAAVSTLEIGIPKIGDEEIERVERRANAVVFEDRPVKTYFVPPERIAEIPFRRPPKKEGVLRVVEIEEFDYSACGGTHCRRTGEVGLIKITKAERIRNNIRFEFLCGGRALGDYQVKNGIVRDLVGRLNVQDKEVPASVEKLGGELKTTKKEIRRLEEHWASSEAQVIVAKAEGRLIQNVFRDRSPEAARALALNLVKRGEFIVLFGAYSEARSHLIFARAGSLPLDLRQIVPLVAPLVNGRGGGSPSLVEIAGERGAHLAPALAKAAELIQIS